MIDSPSKCCRLVAGICWPWEKTQHVVKSYLGVKVLYFVQILVPDSFVAIFYFPDNLPKHQPMKLSP